MYLPACHSRAKDMPWMLLKAANTPAATRLMCRCTSTLHVLPERAWAFPYSTTANHTTGMGQGSLMYDLARAVNIATGTWRRSSPKAVLQMLFCVSEADVVRLVSRIESQDLAASSPRTALWRAILASKDPFDAPFSRVSRPSLKLSTTSNPSEY